MFSLGSGPSWSMRSRTSTISRSQVLVLRSILRRRLPSPSQVLTMYTSSQHRSLDLKTPKSMFTSQHRCLNSSISSSTAMIVYSLLMDKPAVARLIPCLEQRNPLKERIIITSVYSLNHCFIYWTSLKAVILSTS